MKITALVENTSCKDGVGSEHGLSLLIEALDKTILFDTGGSDLFAHNAKELGIDLHKVDMAILSHGHYDHGGGIPTFFTLNNHAPVYLKKEAFGPYYSEREPGSYSYIGIDGALRSSKRFHFTGKETSLEEGISLFSAVTGDFPPPSGNISLFKKTGTGYEQDSFDHEQNLVVEEGTIRLLVTGCSHRGIVNIVHHYKELWGEYPTHVIGGFHLYNHRTGAPESQEVLEKIASDLLATGATYYTCHCTGEENYNVLHSLMAERISYLRAGMVLTFGTEESLS